MVSALGSAFVVGVVLAEDVSLGVAGLFAICFGALVLVDVRLGLAAWLPLIFLPAVAAVGLAVSAAGLLVLAGWLGLLANAPVALELMRRHARTLALVGVLVLWVSMTAIWADGPVFGTKQYASHVTAALLFLVVLSTVSERRHFKLLALALVAGGTLSVILGLTGIANGAIGDSSAALDAASNSGRLGGGSGDPNFLASDTIFCSVLAIGLLAVYRNPLVRWALFVAIGLLAIGFAGAASRGALLALAIVLPTAILVFRGSRGRVFAAAVLVAVVMGGYYASNPDKFERIIALDTATTKRTDTTSGRNDLWRVALRTSEDHLIGGVGVANYRLEAPQYVREPGSLRYVNFVVDDPHAVHNTYLEMLAETGIVGLGLLLAVIAACLTATRRAATRFERLRDRSMTTLARCAFVAQVGLVSATFFVSSASDDRLWVVLALGPALLAVAERAARQRPARTPASEGAASERIPFVAGHLPRHRGPTAQGAALT